MRHLQIAAITDYECNTDIVTLIKARKLNWIGHTNSMDGNRSGEKFFSSHSGDGRTKGRPRSRWWACVCTDIKQERVMRWRGII